MTTFPAGPDFDGKTILITGGTGSFGQTFVKRILSLYTPAKLIVFSRDEYKQYEMSQRFRIEDYPCMRYFLGDVRDQQRLEMAMRGVDYVVHAAALKHVPIAEYNPFECIHTNVIGAENIARASIRCGVSKLVGLSTDKAANPINLYGASKLASDKVLTAANNISGAGGTRFSVVRYGNVVGSRGSVIPYFRGLIDKPVHEMPITDDRMTRFFITLDQGVDFVIKAFAQMSGGEIFVPKIPSVLITDLAHAMAPDLPHRMIGIRPGEKLHELMITRDDARLTLDYGEGYVIGPQAEDWAPSAALAGVAHAVPHDFEYASNTNGYWLAVPEIRQLLHDQGWIEAEDRAPLRAAAESR
ncbi:MAG: UDP-N-acetylglucosamine 4,6-dehydratase (inverting) [Alphaproteobacteria bacterium]|nr:UDP-N-acetylglucosamine 4,6-dehydratase (inverting) [Alphaproteobacteria bacterium]